jgi:hypothetical protein
MDRLSQMLNDLMAPLVQRHKTLELGHNLRANKLTRLWPPGTSPRYRYWQAKRNGKGQEVRFCWATNRNAAGFYLTWREIWRKNRTVVRDGFASRRIRKQAKALAGRRCQAHNDKQGQ